jgi:hypothetical protein
LSSGDEGYLIIHRIKKNEWAKLIFTNGVRAVYEMPADAYKIVEIGPFTCRNNDFSLPVEPDTEAQINFDIQIFVGKKELQLYLPRRPSNKDETTAAPRTQEPASSKHGSRLADFYRTDTEWAVLDKRMNDMAASDAGSSVDWDDVETAGKVVGIILQALTVVGGVAGGVQF